MSEETEKTKVQIKADASSAQDDTSNADESAPDKAEENATTDAAEAPTVKASDETKTVRAKKPENGADTAAKSPVETSDEAALATPAETVQTEPQAQSEQGADQSATVAEDEPPVTQELPPEVSASKDDTLVKKTQPTTRKIPEPQDILRTARYGEAVLGDRAKLKITLRGVEADPIEIEVEDDFIIGRASQETGESPDLDLLAFDAVEKGVSRHHLVIMKRGDTLHVMDMESTNGTYLNGVWMYPKQPRVLRDGDELMLGSLVLQIKFVWQELPPDSMA